MRGVHGPIREFRGGWHQGVINRAEERVAKSESILAAMGEKPHRPGDCSACRRPRRRPCPRPQCHGWESHGWVRHWFGWVLR